MRARRTLELSCWPSPNVRLPGLPTHFKNSGGRLRGGGTRGAGGGHAPAGPAPARAARAGCPLRPGQWGGAAAASALTPALPLPPRSAAARPPCGLTPHLWKLFVRTAWGVSAPGKHSFCGTKRPR